MISIGEYQRVYDPSIGEDERWYINDHTFVRDETGVWHLIGITHAEPFAPFDELHLAHATSPTLLGPWTKHPYALSTDAEWHESHLWAPHVIRHDDRYWMFVCAGGPAPDRYRIHLATSTDCWDWTRHPENPLVVDGYEARDPMVLRIDDRWVMYYTATSEPSGGNHVVKAVESDDLVSWGSPTTVFVDPMVGTGGGPTESPFVVERPDGWYLFVGPDAAGINEAIAAEDFAAVNEAYSRTRVFRSDDPRHFGLDDHVATIHSHAAEVVVDEAGDWWISRCGWAQGGVHLAPLHWD